MEFHRYSRLLIVDIMYFNDAESEIYRKEGR